MHPLTASHVHAAVSANPPPCETTNNYDGRVGLRISSIAVIFVGSTMGAVFPVFARDHRGIGIPDWAFFVAKYFGSGVIIATAFIHLLAPATETLRNPCLQGPIAEYPWAEGITLMTIFTMFFLEILVMRYSALSNHTHHHGHIAAHDHESHLHRHSSEQGPSQAGGVEPHHNLPGADHLGHSRDHRENPKTPDWAERGIIPESYAAQMTGIFILEFGVIFHSIFIGLTLAVTGKDSFVTLYIILALHQTFEGLGLGARLAMIPWPRSRRRTPYLLALGYGVSTPVAIAIGIGARHSYAPGSQTTLIVNGVFDSLSAGILIYTGLIELMAHEFMFSPYMQKGPLRRVLSAYLLMCLGAGLMALLGKWA
ncbi:putative plasma membrane low affinity zinc ion transporter [Sporormia fimetaria CBS 119925]|uniref:Plasma membrane low affinity zinc ion transporter n=1 Tax=Sporormia fimetaria CBS 119925 TaxID=1340428 RepID=A0A6A6VMY7_9PLEO|nr:putative plasma membrane low affinity zinc ion transporter [Sporormia fimetaria CBS 119925]